MGADNSLIGKATTAEVGVDGHQVECLLDTGATVSTIQEGLAARLGLKIEPVTNLVRVECANGQSLPYMGYAVADITIRDLKANCCPLLVTPDHSNTRSAPVLLGTNILAELLQNSSTLHSPLPEPLNLVNFCLKERENKLKVNNGSIANLHAKIENRIYLEPRKVVTVPVREASTVSGVPVGHVIIEGRQEYPGLEVSPDLHLLKDFRGDEAVVTLSNTSNSAFLIEPDMAIAQLSPILAGQNFSVQAKEVVLPDLSNAKVTEQDRETLFHLVSAYPDVFSQDDLDLGHYSGVKHEITLEDPRPFKQRYRRIPPHMYAEVADHLQQLYASGVIRPSKSPYSSPIVCGRKKNGKLRMCVDFRLLNTRTKKDNYCLPRIDEILDSLQGAKYFSKLDLKSGYYQIEMEEKDKELTAFTTGPLGFWEHNRLPFGLCNSPATFQRVMEDCFADLNLKVLFIYIDDLIIFSDTIEEHLQRLEMVFERLRLCGLKLASDKCELIQTEISFLGFIVSSEGIKTDPEKVSKVQEWPVPKCAKDLRSFLGFASYYRRFVEGFSVLAKPLTKLLPASNSKEKTLPPWEWGQSQQAAFDTLKHHLCNAPVLAFPDFQKPFRLEIHVDASGEGLGAVLCQDEGGVVRPVAYASRSLTKAEMRYPPHKREFLGLKWGIVDKFNDYLWGAPKFVVKTDNNPLTYVLTSAKLDATGHRWLAALASYNFDIQYVPGKSNGDADGLSRIPVTVNTESIQAVCNAISAPFAECMQIDSDQFDASIDGTAFPHFSPSEIRKAQNEDEVVGVWMTALRQRKPPRLNNMPQPRKHGVMKRNFSKLFLQRGVMYRDTGSCYQLVLPQKLVTVACEALHDDCGHQGVEKTLSLIQRRFFWPGMTVDVADWVENCGRCVRFKSRPHLAPLVGIHTSEPMELVTTDFLKVDESSGGTKYILVITDHFTRFAQAVPTRNMSARTTAEALLGFFKNFGLPRRLHSDQGANFESKVIRELCLLLGVSKSRTTPYHPMGNGACERMNQTLIRMLGTLPDSKKKSWPKHLGMLVLAYNSTPHDATGFSPYFLMFGREARLPIDNQLPRERPLQTVEDVKEALDAAWISAQANSKAAKEKSKQYYDRKVKGACLEPGDRVLVRRCAFDGPHKLKDRWSQEVYLVIDKPNADTPVYKVRPVGGGGTSTLHRNLLLPVQAIRELPQEAAPARKVVVEQHKPVVPPKGSPVASEDEWPDWDTPNDESDSDLEEEANVVYTPKQAHTAPTVESETGTAPSSPRPSSPRPADQETTVPSPASPVRPVPTPRRSTRPRQPTFLQRSDDYVFSATVHSLVSLLNQPGIDNEQLTAAIIQLIVSSVGDNPSVSRGCM